MPGFTTEVIDNQILDCFFGGATLVPPATLYFGLSLTPARKSSDRPPMPAAPGGPQPPPSSEGSIIEPLDTTGYARVGMVNNATNFPAAANSSKANGTVIQFPLPTADWGLIVSVFAADAPVGGTALVIVDLPQPKLISVGDPAPKLVVGAFFIEFTYDSWHG